MATKHHLFTTAELFAPNERKSFSLADLIGTSEDGRIRIMMTDSRRVELRHADGRHLVIDLTPLYSQGEAVFTLPEGMTDDQLLAELGRPAMLERLARLMEEFDYAARAHEMKGSQPVDDHAAIQEEYRLAAAALWLTVSGLLRQNGEQRALLELGSATIHAVVDSAIGLAEELLRHVDAGTPGLADMRQKLAALRAMKPATAADVAPATESVQ